MLTGEGSDFPDLAIIQGNKVVYADQGNHSTALCISLVHKRTYQYPTNPPINALKDTDFSDLIPSSLLSCDSPSGPGLGQEIDELDFADVEGIGKMDAFVSASCKSPTTGWPDVLVVYDGASNPYQPTVLAVLLTTRDGTDSRGLRMGSLNGIPQSVTVSGSVVTVVSYGYLTNDPNCCPSQKVTDTFTWNGSGFTRGHRQVSAKT